MYGKLDVSQWPIGAKWSELKVRVEQLYSLSRYMHRFVRDPPHYVLIVNANVFSFDEGVPPYEFVLLKREYGRREVLGTFDNIDTALGAIKLVLSNVQEEYDNFDRS